MRWLLLFLVAAMALVGCSLPGETNQSSGPTREELCQALGRDPESDSLCNYDTDAELRYLLEDSFPPGQATANQVFSALAPYHLSSMPREIGGTLETYAIERTLFPDDPVLAIFSFDADGILVSITLND